jgi:hypothetical protein
VKLQDYRETFYDFSGKASDLNRQLGFATATGTNQQPAELRRYVRNKKANAMHLGYIRPFSFQIGVRPEPKVSSVRHGVTEITLSDGRLVRATLHVKSVKADPSKPGTIDVSYNIVAEMMAKPDSPILDVHETVQ